MATEFCAVELNCTGVICTHISSLVYGMGLNWRQQAKSLIEHDSAANHVLADNAGSIQFDVESPLRSCACRSLGVQVKERNGRYSASWRLAITRSMDTSRLFLIPIELYESFGDYGLLKTGASGSERRAVPNPETWNCTIDSSKCVHGVISPQKGAPFS